MKTTENKIVWFVLKLTKFWTWDENLKMFVWVEKSRKDLTEYRTTKEESNKDFEKLGFKINPNDCVQCKDFIKPNESWIRYIVQNKLTK